MKPLAIIPVYNECDILPAVLRHLAEQGCECYVLDNWSTDGSELAIPPWMGWERWPSTRPSEYDWTGILTRIEEIALERGQGRWVMLHDADEIRRGPDGLSLATALARITDLAAPDYNTVGFTVRTYAPVDNSWRPGGDPEAHFRYYKPDTIDSHLSHVKAWFQGSERVNLHSTGGHEVQFTGRRIYPEPFLLKHYPIRGQSHGERKVLAERFPRYLESERAWQWHVQYNDYVSQPKPNFPHAPSELIEDQVDYHSNAIPLS